MMWAFRGFHGYSVLVPCIFFDPRSNKMEMISENNIQ